MSDLRSTSRLNGEFDSYPNLKPEHIQAANQYAADVVAMDEMLFQ